MSRGVLGVPHAVHQSCLAELPEGAQRLPRSVVCGGEARRGAPSEGSAPAGPGPGCGGEDLPPLPPLALEMAGAGMASAATSREFGFGARFGAATSRELRGGGKADAMPVPAIFSHSSVGSKKLQKKLPQEQNICP